MVAPDLSFGNPILADRMRRLSFSIDISGQVPIASSDRYAEELGAPLVNQFAQVPLQTPPENGAGDKAPAQGSAQVRP